VALVDQRLHVAEEEGEQQRRDVMTVRVGVHQEEDLAVAQLGEIDRLAHAAAERRDDVLELLVGEQLLVVGLLGVEHLAAQRQDRLGAAVAALLGGAAGGLALDDEQLAVARVGGAAVGELAGEVEAVRDRRLAGDGG